MGVPEDCRPAGRLTAPVVIGERGNSIFDTSAGDNCRGKAEAVERQRGKCDSAAGRNAAVIKYVFRDMPYEKYVNYHQRNFTNKKRGSNCCLPSFILLLLAG